MSAVAEWRPLLRALELPCVQVLACGAVWFVHFDKGEVVGFRCNGSGYGAAAAQNWPCAQEAIAAATAFLAQFRLPAVAS